MRMVYSVAMVQDPLILYEPHWIQTFLLHRELSILFIKEPFPLNYHNVLMMLHTRAQSKQSPKYYSYWMLE